MLGQVAEDGATIVRHSRVGSKSIQCFNNGWDSGVINNQKLNTHVMGVFHWFLGINNMNCRSIIFMQDCRGGLSEAKLMENGMATMNCPSIQTANMLVGMQ